MPAGVPIAAFHEGDEELFARLVAEHSPRLLAALRRYARDAEEADELLQATWVRAFEKRRTYSGAGSLIGWLFTICRTVGTAHAERRVAERRLRDLGEDVRSPLATDAQAEAADLRRAIFEAVLDLPAAQREVVWLRLVEGRSTIESAALLGCPPGTVKSRLHHALSTLQHLLQGVPE